ncbi:uncharacterized protein LOC111288875 [Durio zibethinus]|uniref:Uncharacterized protein LOC111288875 n=1 Tax=Durio zibethinus TaxID=66656 RepID=A0A6P5Y572_DURZI|nr:uncharacterized protein LOC111288875 [Durio zibethinus]
MILLVGSEFLQQHQSLLPTKIRETIILVLKAIMASLNVYVAVGVLAIMAISGAVMARDVDPIKAYDCENKRKMTWNCINEVFASIFKTGTVSDECCHQLVNLGLTCHEALVKRTLQNPLFKNNDKLVIFSKTAQIWNNCSLVGDVSPSPSPRGI